MRKDKEICGIKIGNTDCKLSQYADDTTMILDGSEHSFSKTLDLFDKFANISGLKVNYEKTEALWIGSCKSSSRVIPSNKPISWAERKVYALGVWFSTLGPNDIDVNFTEKIEKINNILGSWSARKLTLLGKIAVLKSLVVSQIVYVLSSLAMPQGVMNEVNSLLYNFLWDGKSDKIKKTEMINDKNKGGLRMIDFQSFNQSLKMKWIKGYLDNTNHRKWKLFFDYYLERHGGELVFLGNLRQQDVPLLNLSDPFLIEIIEYWCTLINYRDENLNFNSTQIWHNSMITIDNRPFFYKPWFKAGVKEVKDLLDADQNFMSYTTFMAKYKIQTNYLEYYKVLSALKHFRKTCLSNLNNQNPQKTAESLLSSSNVCKTVYKCFIEKKASTPVKSQGKWLSEDDVIRNLEINWENTYRLPFLCTTETKLRVFQFKFLHRRIATNDFLHKIGTRQVDSCSFCDNTTETLVHLFWNCKYSQFFWKNTLQWISQNLTLTKEVSFSPALCFGLIDSISNLLLHHFLLIARHYIYTCRLRSTLPILEVYIQLVMNSMDIENKIAFDYNTTISFKKKWAPFKYRSSENN